MSKQELTDKDLANRLHVTPDAIEYFKELIESRSVVFGDKDVLVRIHDEPHLAYDNMLATIGDYSGFLKSLYIFVETDGGPTFVVSKKLLSKVACVNVDFDEEEEEIFVIHYYSMKAEKI